MEEEVRDLRAFLKENAEKNVPVFYVASPRFKDENGEPIYWELHGVTNNEIDKLQKRNTKYAPVKGTREVQRSFNAEQFALDLTIQSIVYPNLHDVELQQSYDACGAEELLKAMLTPGELADLILAVNEANGFKAGMDDKIKQAKN